VIVGFFIIIDEVEATHIIFRDIAIIVIKK